MKKVMLFGALIALFASSNLYAATCTDTAADGYTDDCDAIMRLDLPIFAIIQFPGGAGVDDLTVVWDGTNTTLTDTIGICIGTNGAAGVDVDASSSNLFNVTDTATDVPYALTLNGDALTLGTSVNIPVGTVDTLACAGPSIPLVLSFAQADLQAATTTGIAAPFRDTVTIVVAPQ